MPKGFTKNELLIGIPTIVVIVALAIWGIWYEFARMTDAKQYGETLAWHSALSLYFHIHGVYPTTPTDGMSLQGKCLIDEGFVNSTDKACLEASRVYNASDESATIYYPRTEGNTICNDSQGCARYFMTVPQKTRSISGQNRDIFRSPPRGIHIFGPEGLLIDQKQIPGI